MEIKKLSLRALLLGGLVMTGLTEVPAQAMGAGSVSSSTHECGTIAPRVTGPAHVDLVIETEAGSFVQSLYFAQESAEISVAAQAFLSELASDLSTYDTVSIDLMVPDTFDEDVSLLRAQAIVDQLEQSGFGLADETTDTPMILTASL